MNLGDLDHLACKGLGVWLDDQDYQERMVLQGKGVNLVQMVSLESLDHKEYKVFLD